MASAFNSYPSPVVNMGNPTSATGAVTEPMLEYLAATRPWVRFLSIVGVVLSVLIVLMGVGATIFGLVDGSPMALAGIVYLLVSLIYILPTLHLHRYAEAIRQTQLHPDAPAVEHALRCQQSFWNVVGVIVAIVLAIYALAFAAALVFMSSAL